MVTVAPRLRAETKPPQLLCVWLASPMGHGVKRCTLGSVHGTVIDCRKIYMHNGAEFEYHIYTKIECCVRKKSGSFPNALNRELYLQSVKFRSQSRASSVFSI